MIDRPHRVAAFLAQIAQESGSLTRFTENLNYDAQGLANTWPNRYAVDPLAKPRTPNALAWKLHRNKELIANYTYASRMGNGPPESGDGWKYRGRGPKQITGYNNYLAYEAASGHNVVNNPDMLLDPLIGADAAGWYWDMANCSMLIDRGDFRGVTIAINGGLTGYDERVRFWVKAKQVLGVA